MTPVKKPLRRGVAISIATLALACVGAAPAPAMLHPEPRSVTAHGPGSPLREGNRVLAEVRFRHGALTAVDELRSAGAQILHASRRLQTVTVAAKPGVLGALDGVDGVENASLVPTPVTYGTCGSVDSEGDTQLAAAEARADFGVDGRGVTVGILSDSFDTDPEAATRAATDVATGDLPGTANPCGFTDPLGVLDDSFSAKSTDEGRGMAQIVHDLAPGARIEFATAFEGESAFADSIRALAAAGASVIVDDVSYLGEPAFQDGPVAVAINEVVAKGVSYFTAAGNDNLFEEEPLGSGKLNDREIASWEAPAFRDAAGCPAQLEAATFNPVTLGKADHCLDFDPGAGEDDTFGISVEEEEELTVAVQWAEPWSGVQADLDAYLLDEEGKPLLDEKGNLVGSTSNNVAQLGTAECEAQVSACQRPVEFFGWENKGPETKVQLAIDRCFSTQVEAEAEKGCNPGAEASAKPRVKVILLENGAGVNATEYHESSGGDVVGPSIYGHAGTAGAISLGAIRVGVGDAPERYSSRGPVTHYFGPVSGATPAPPLKQTISKPNAVASDCGRTTFFVPTGAAGIFRFCGTSAAAPHAAAIAALARQANPSLTPAQLRDGLAATARPVGSFGPNAVGAGLVDAHNLLEDVALPPAIAIVSPPAAISRNRSPSIGFTANRPVSFACSLDGSEPRPCTSPFTPLDPLSDGLHGFAVRGEDLAGRVGVSPTVTFTVDTLAPRTSFGARPRKVLRTRGRRAKAVFGFVSSEPGSTFTCRIDGGLLHYCPSRFVKRYKVGRHVVRAMAVDAAGNVDKTPAAFRFKVVRVGRGSR
jgi:subtilisin family serine protease